MTGAARTSRGRPPPWRDARVLSALSQIGAVVLVLGALWLLVSTLLNPLFYIGATVDRVRLSLVGSSGMRVALSWLFLGIGIRGSSAFAASVAVALEPVFAALLAWALLSEGFTAPQALGGALVVTGVAITFLGGLRAEALPRARKEGDDPS